MTNKSVYIASPEALVGKSTIALGLIETLSRQVKSVGMFRPVVRGDHDDLTHALLTHTGIDQTYDEVVGVQAADAQTDPEAAITSIIEQYGALQDRFDALVVIGTDYDGATTPTELELNARIAANLNAPVVLTVSGMDRDIDQITASAQNAIRAFDEQHINLAAIIANRVNVANVDDVAWRLGELNRGVSGALPESALLSAPSVREQFTAVGATMWRGSEAWLDRESLSTVIGGMSMPNMLSRLEPECTLLLASDRAEMLPGLLLAHASDTFPDLAAILLVGGYEIPASITTLLDGIEVDIPIGTVETGSWDTAAKLHSLLGDMTSSQRKYAEALKLFQDRINEEALVGALDVARTQLRTPRMFEYQIMQKARADKKTIVLPESEDPRILEATSILLTRGVANLVLLGEEAKVRADAASLGFDITGAKIQSMYDPELVEKFAATYAELRAKKGVTLEQAREKMTDPSYFGTMMVHLGLADGMVSGATHTTANTIRPALEFIKTKPGLKTVSGSFLMCMPDQVLVFADCAVNPNPTPEQLCDIAISSAATAKAFDIEPRVAMLSYSTGDSGKGEDVDAVKAAVELIRGTTPEFAFDGPIQFDAAMDPKVGGQKMPGSQVAGRASVFIFPDLNTGNNTYKAVQRTAGAIAVGPMLQGLNKPVNDLSRGALVADIVNTVAITAIQAQG
ncbi:phosphate acetyltransferase [Propionibacterium sp. oral taxon 192 str. F0372]|uniref:phosphate acetyltransferase n=1 Tax=Propionibacterium sp. oral taxon 192 TaxID=671222 RepID=UPI000352A153|nr:phosphate acetyltransferase [Propionibacterium sp. oral taxon 192]EPH06153.1 phosphate acetyltransferase [Propionibacterium sp. oral taxon 192 str. F0372]